MELNINEKDWLKTCSEFVPKGWGQEEVICNHQLYCGKILTVMPGKKCSIHRHRKHEHFYVLEGTLNLVIYQDRPEMWEQGVYPISESLILKEGEGFCLGRNVIHSFTTFDKPCKFIEFSTPHIEDEVERILKGD